MRARAFLAVVLAAGLLALSLAVAGWWAVWQRGPLRLEHRSLTMPAAARFVPRQAPLSLFLATDGEEPVAYARAVAPPRRRREAADAVGRLRDGAFAAAGLDYPSELAAWLGPEIAVALLEAPADPATATAVAPATEGGTGWLLALRGRDGEGARRFLQRFWQTRSLAGTDLQVSSYRGMGLISGRGALRGQRAVPLATALVEDDLVLIASGRGVLEQALDVSQIDELNLAGQPRLARALEQLGLGSGLLVARPPAFSPWLGLPLPTEAEGRPLDLVAALRPEGSALRLQGRLELPEGSHLPLPQVAPAPEQGDRLRQFPEARLGQPDSLALLEDPAAWLQVPLLRPLLARAVEPQAAADAPGAGVIEAASPLPAVVAAADDGPLLVADGPEGWVMGTTVDRPPPETVEAALAAQGLIAAPVELEGRELTVWTRLSTAAGRSGRRGGGGDPLQASLAGWRSEEGRLAWWGGSSLAVLQDRGGDREGRLRQRQLLALGDASAPLRWALGPEPARRLLAPWQPWRLLAAVAGGGFDPAVDGVALSLAPDGRALRFQARLEIG